MRTIKPWDFDPVPEYDDVSDLSVVRDIARDALHEGCGDVLFRSLLDDPDLEAPASVWRH